MNVRFTLRLTVLLVCFSFALSAGSINLFTLPFTHVGDYSVKTTYTDMVGNSHTASTPGAPFGVVGGVFPVLPTDPNNSTAVWATNNGVLDMIGWAANGNTCVGAAAGVCTTTALQTALGLTTFDMNGLLPTVDQFGAPWVGGIANGSAIIWSNVAVTAGDTLNFDVNFIANDNDPFMDFAFFSAATAGTEDVQLIDGVWTVGDYGSSGWKTFSYLFGTSGTYTLAFGAVNAGLYNLQSTGAAAMDSFNLDPTDPGYDDFMTPSDFDSALLTQVPEPGSWFLAGSALLLLPVIVRRRKK